MKNQEQVQWSVLLGKVEVLLLALEICSGSFSHVYREFNREVDTLSKHTMNVHEGYILYQFF